MPNEYESIFITELLKLLRFLNEVHLILHIVVRVRRAKPLIVLAEQEMVLRDRNINWSECYFHKGCY